MLKNFTVTKTLHKFPENQVTITEFSYTHVIQILNTWRLVKQNGQINVEIYKINQSEDFWCKKKIGIKIIILYEDISNKANS